MKKKTTKFIDDFGGEHEVPEHLLPTFERCRKIMLIAGIVIKVAILAVLLYFAFVKS